jgi:hypothetical protein
MLLPGWVLPDPQAGATALKPSPGLNFRFLPNSYKKPKNSLILCLFRVNPKVHFVDTLGLAGPFSSILLNSPIFQSLMKS